MRSLSLAASLLALAAASAAAQTTTVAPDASGQSPAAAEITESGETIVAGDEVYRSFEEMEDDDAVTIGGGYAEDEIIDADVVNRDGEALGEIVDLAVGADGQARHALIDVSGFFDVESRYVLVDLAQLRRGEGDADEDEFVLDMDANRLGRLSRYTRGEDGWRRDYAGE